MLRAAVKQLRAKMSNAAPSLAIVCASALHDSAVVYRTLREQLPATTQFVSQPSVGGVVVDGQWLTNQGFFLAVMGIADPDGAYVTFAAEYEPDIAYVGMPKNPESAAEFTAGTGVCDRDDVFLALEQKRADSVAASVRAAARAAFAAGVAEKRVKDLPGLDAPQLVLGFTNGSYPAAAVDAIMGVVGAVVPMAGGGCPCMPTPDGGVLEPSLWHDGGAREGAPDGGVVHKGFVGVMCWPSVHAAGAFCSGLQPDTSLSGVITETLGPEIIAKIDGRPAFDVFTEWLLSNEVLAREAKQFLVEQRAASLAMSAQLGMPEGTISAYSFIQHYMDKGADNQPDDETFP